MAYLALGFAAVWAVVFIFVFSMVRREQALDREIAALRELIAERKGEEAE
ncbi:MAG: CcmD family protein [Anaerolineae bacterium]|nr:CcmD family protein [Anaerolineae bacterium]